MKKLVAIALIAAMATVANAGAFVAWNAANTAAIPLDGLGRAIVTPGQVITIKLVAGVGGSLGFNIGAVDDGAPRGTVVSFWTNPGLGTELSPGYIENADPEPGLSGALISYWAFVTTAAPVPAGADLIRFVYTVPSVVTAPITIATLPAGAAFRSPADGAVWVVEASAVGRGLDIIEIGSVTLIPEPMTIGLLGLGGLFLRRRLA